MSRNILYAALTGVVLTLGIAAKQPAPPTSNQIDNSDGTATSALGADVYKDLVTIDPPRSVNALADGINADRKIVGTFWDANGTSHGFLRSEDGRFVTIDHPRAQKFKGGGGTGARGINSAGLIVGDYCAALPCDGTSVYRGYLLKPDKDDYDRDGFDKDDFTTIRTPGHINTIAQRINSEGDIVGCYHDTDTMKTMHGILLDEGKFTALPVPFSMNNGINDRKAISGFYFDLNTGAGHGYLIRKGVRTLIDFPGAASTLAWDINNHGRVVGFYFATNGSVHGFLWQKGEFTAIDIPGAVATFVYGINSAGDIVGKYDDTTRSHGFLLHWRDYEDRDSDDNNGN
jgi:probable HAF family extracellular repeat protein